jgi:5-methylthioribose kinase
MPAMSSSLDIEQPAMLLSYLRSTNRIGAGETPRFTVLQGGVSNRTVLVERAHAPGMVLKQALAKLRVAEDWFCDPSRIHREALGLAWLHRLAPPGTITPLLFEDRDHHLLAMQAVPPPHDNWKTRLLSGTVDRRHIEQFGQLLGTIHRRALDHAGELGAALGDRTFFETLRIEPYYRFAASRTPTAAAFLSGLIKDTLATRLTLVHGDYSPKNLLIFQDRLILLDHEVIHWGDPAFDLGFSMTHLLSKACHLPAQRRTFLEAAHSYWASYQNAAGTLTRQVDLESRAVRHTLGCLLARVDGRSPLEYLSPVERNQQRQRVLRMFPAPPSRLPELIDAYGASLGM